MHPNPYFSPAVSLPAHLKALRLHRNASLSRMSRESGLSRVTASAAEGAADPRLSTLMTLFGVLGYTLLPVPKSLASEVAAFVANAGEVISQPAGVEAPLNDSLAAFKSRSGAGDDGNDGGASQ